MNYENHVTALLKFRTLHARQQNVTTRLISIEVAPPVYHPGKVLGRVLQRELVIVAYAGSQKQSADAKQAGAPQGAQNSSIRRVTSYAVRTCVGSQDASLFHLCLAERSYAGSL